jgi:hypothetical protein
VYDVLNARTSEKNGAPPTIEAAAGSVTFSESATPQDRIADTPTDTRIFLMGIPLSSSPRRLSSASSRRQAF